MKFNTSAVWFVTKNCNLNCPYCDVVDNSVKDTRIYTEWVVAWNRICPDLLDITGGEPFLLPGFVDMLKDISPSTRFGITTNLTMPMEEFARCIEPKRVVNITCSRHPSMYKQPKEMFDGKVRLLVTKGFKVTVNVVAYPDQMYLIPELKRHYEDMGAHFHVDPFREGGDMLKYPYSAEQKRFLKRYVTMDRAEYLKDVKYNKAFCSAGQDHVVVMPNGDFWPCLLYYFRGEEPRGNVFVSHHVFRNGTICGEYHNCIGCDRDKVSAEVV